MLNIISTREWHKSHFLRISIDIISKSNYNVAYFPCLYYLNFRFINYSFTYPIDENTELWFAPYFIKLHLKFINPFTHYINKAPMKAFNKFRIAVKFVMPHFTATMKRWYFLTACRQRDCTLEYLYTKSIKNQKNRQFDS